MFVLGILFRNEILEQNPELAEELLGEIDRMKEEKERLEKERKEMLAQKELLEQQLAEKNNDGSTSASGGSSRMWGAPLDTGIPRSKSQSTEGSSTGSTLSSLVDDIQSSTIESAYDTYQDHSAADKEEEDDDEEEKEKDPCGTPEPNTSSAAKVDSSSTSTDFSLKGFIQEVMIEFEKDVHRVTSLILPVVKPIFGAGNKAWNYVKWVFRSARQQYQRYKAAATTTSEPSQSSSSTAGKGQNNPLETK